MAKNDLSPIKITSEKYQLNHKQIKIFTTLANELRNIEEKSKHVDQIIARGGFIIDTLLSVEPSDIDLFYSLKGNIIDCKCNEIKKEVESLHLPLLSQRKVDLGHVLENEIFFPPVEKVVGPFSHHIDIPSMVCLDSRTNLWTNNLALTCLKEKAYEIRPFALLMHHKFPYSPENPYYLNFYTSYSRLMVRGLKMIHKKGYKKFGSNFLFFLENWPSVLEVVKSSDELTQAIQNYIIEKCPGMKFTDFKKAIITTKSNNNHKIINSIKFLF